MNLIEESKKQLIDYYNSGRRVIMYMSYLTPKRFMIDKEKCVTVSPNNIITVHYINGDVEYINYNDINYIPYWSQNKIQEWISNNFRIIDPSCIRNF